MISLVCRRKGIITDFYNAGNDTHLYEIVVMKVSVVMIKVNENDFYNVKDR